MSRVALVAVALAAFALSLAPAEASKVKTWQTSSSASYDKAKFKETVVSNQGVVRLSKQLKHWRRSTRLMCGMSSKTALAI